MRKPAFCICEYKDADQLRGLIIAFVFAIRIVQSLFYLNPKFQASIHPLWLYSPVCVGPGQKPRRPGFSQRGSFDDYKMSSSAQQRHCFRYINSTIPLNPKFQASSHLLWLYSLVCDLVGPGFLSTPLICKKSQSPLFIYLGC